MDGLLAPLKREREKEAVESSLSRVFHRCDGGGADRERFLNPIFTPLPGTLFVTDSRY